MEKSLDSYVKELVLNVRTNHPVTVVYTDDPNETIALTKDAIPTIRETTDKIFYWSARQAWTDITARDKDFAFQLANPVEVKLTDKQKKTPLAYTFSSPEELKDKAKYPIFIMSLLSVQFKKDVMTIMQELRDFDYMVRHGQNNTYRLIIIANKSFEIPHDYENLFGVVHHDLPTKEEIRKVFQEDFLSDYIDEKLQKVYSGDFVSLRKQFEDQEEYVLNTLAGLTERQVRITLMKGVSKNHTKMGKAVTEVDIEGFKKFLYEYKFAEISKSGVLSIMDPIPLEDVGGLELYKEWLIERSRAFSPEAEAKGIKTPKGAVLVGPSGTGKSYLAKATAGVLKYPCIQLNLSSIFNKFVGESESNMEQIKATIEAMSPAVVFIDEIDKVFAGENRGSSGDSGVTSRVLGKLLTWIQETKAKLFFVVTANRVQNIPSELMRKGRFDEIWCVTFPTAKERNDIMSIHLHKRGYELSDISKAVQLTDDFSAAELEHIVAESALQAFIKDEDLSERHLVAEIEKTNPISEAFKDDIAFMKEWADKHARPASIKQTFNTDTEKEVI
jgi:SpoVK/Ycf46/Vps4 family AAA+-type ATPase